MAFSEQFETRPIGWDRNGKLRGTRVFLVDGEPPTAKNDPNLPPTGSEFPGYPALTLDSYEAVRFSPTQSKVTGAYTSDKSGTFGGSTPPPDPVDPFFASWSLDFRFYDQAIPFVQVDSAKHSYVDVRTNPPTEKQITGYTESEEVHTESRMVATKRVVIAAAFGQTQIAQIKALNGTIVQIGVDFYRFSVGQVEETGPALWSTSYTFEGDNGTPDIYTNTATLKWPKAMRSVIAGVYPDTDYARPPFHKIVTEPGVYDPGPPPYIGPPRFVAVPMYARAAVLNEYENLPGWRD